MCKRYSSAASGTYNEAYRDTERLTRSEVYEGPTVRLDTPAGVSVQGHSGSCGHHWPWHLLWLIWPLFFLAKWLVPLIVSAVTALFTSLTTPIVLTIPLLPLVLIGVGIVLLLRQED